MEDEVRGYLRMVIYHSFHHGFFLGLVEDIRSL